MGKLQPKQIEALPAGSHGDGNNLYIVVKPTGARSHLLRYYWQGRPLKMGLGSTRDVTLDAAIDANRLIAKGTNPRDVRDQAQQAQASVLFGKFAEELRQTKEKGFRNEAHKTKWRYNVQIRFKPLHSKRIDQITTADVLDIIKPIWLAAPVAARDARTQLESILSATKAAGHRTGENPAAWKDNLKRLRRALCSGWSAC